MVNNQVEKNLQNNHKIGITLSKYNGCHLISSSKTNLLQIRDEDQEVSFEQSRWKIKSSFSKIVDNEDAMEAYIKFKIAKGQLLQGNVAVNFMFNDWSSDNYVLMPAAIYNGNRFKVSKQDYPPMMTKEDEIGANIPTTITDVPRLNVSEGESKIQLRTGDMATPIIGVFDPNKKKGFFMLTTQKTTLGNSGISIEENMDRTQAVISLSAPAVRQDYKYSMCTTKEESDDKGYDFNEQDEVSIKFRIYSFDCEDITEFYKYFIKIRKDLSGPVNLKHEIPFWNAWEIEEKKYNRDNWVSEFEFYKSSTAIGDCIYAEWQTGWVGGGMSTYPMIIEGNELSRERCFKTLDFIFNKVQADTGFFYGIYYKGELYGDDFKNTKNQNLVLLRKNADAIYFIAKQLIVIKKKGYMKKIPDMWVKGLQKASDAFVRLWKKYGQFGQFIDIQKEEIIIGGTSSVGIASAGIALAGQYFENLEYIEVAKQSAKYYYENYVKKGITNGAPGEICQCPDSESAFGLLESYVVLYEVTKDKKWITMAEDAANQCASWCMSYDYDFPSKSTFSQLGRHTVGAVWANVQNKHAAPGICTLSGDALFKLYRATGNKFYIELLREISHNISQYLSTEELPFKKSWNNYNCYMNNLSGEEKYIPTGWIDERINTSDWEGKINIGGIPIGSCWCEVSNLLTYIEVPGIYIQKDTGYICVLDHVDIQIIGNNDKELVIDVVNSTKFKAKVKIFIETEKLMKEPLSENAIHDCKVLNIEPLSNKIISIKK